MRQGPWRRLAQRLFAEARFRWGAAVLAALLAVAGLADFMASDKPILLRFRGELFVAPNVLEAPALRGYDLLRLREELAADDWMLEPLVPWGPSQHDKGTTVLSPPDARHWLGTDHARRDALARLIHGTRLAVVVGFTAVAIYVLLGTLLGLVAGYFGGWIDALVSRLIEGLLALPIFFIVLAILGLLERAGVSVVALTIGLVSWTRLARLVRGEALRVRRLEFVEAARALGGSHVWVMGRHVLPNVLGPVLVSAAFGLAGAVLIESSLSFLGFGVPDSVASWGALMRGAMQDTSAWWLVVFPGALVFATVVACNAIGEAVRDAVDPRGGFVV